MSYTCAVRWCICTLVFGGSSTRPVCPPLTEGATSLEGSRRVRVTVALARAEDALSSLGDVWNSPGVRGTARERMVDWLPVPSRESTILNFLERDITWQSRRGCCLHRGFYLCTSPTPWHICVVQFLLDPLFSCCVVVSSHVNMFSIADITTV